MLTDKALKNVQACLATCDELINGRFIFAENIIAKILQNISESDEIYGLIAECMKNFNFEKEFNRAKVKLPTKDGYFIMPESKAIVLPLVFCILVDIRDKKINFHEFVRNYFMSEDLNEFDNFTKTVIVPFKNAIAYCFDLDNKNEDFEPKEYSQTNIEELKHNNCENINDECDEQVSVNKSVNKIDKVLEGNQETRDFVEDIAIIVNQMLAELNSEKKVKEELKNDIEYLLNNMLYNCKNFDTRNLSANIVAVEYVVKPVKSLKFLARELKLRLADFFFN